MGNPSDHVETPLTGGYLLIVLAEPRSAEHKLAILKKLTKGLSCWNYEESGVDIVTEFNAIVNQNIEGEEGKNGEQLFQYASDNLVAEILINPQHSTLVQCVRNLLASFTKYRCIIHAGYSFTENGSWILQDGSFSVTDFLDAYKTAEAQRTIRLHENQIRIELHCSADADWNQVSRVKGTRFLLNPPEKIIDIESIESIVRWLCDKIEVAELDILLEGSQVVGNIRFSRPTLYVFPAGQGDSALFGINGFNMLIDGGAGRNSCFWGFARHLDRLDAVLLTRLNSSNLEGVASFLKRKTMSSLYPQIGHFFCNFKTRKQISSPDIDAKQDVLSISLIDTAQSIITDLKQLQLRPHLCYRNINLEPINLYHKVGHGKLDMYVLNPSKDSKEVKDFLTKWNEGDQKLFNPTKDLQFPLPNIISVCTLLVWQPANPNTTITRILFPGSSPQNKIFESLERVRHLDFLKHPSCSIKSMSSSTSVTVKSQTTKKTVLEKMIPGETKTVKTLENLEVSTSASNAVIQTAIIPTVPKELTPKPKFPVETEKPKQSIKLVMKETANAKPKIEHKYSSISARVNSNKIAQKSSTTKKSLKLSSKSPPTDKSSPTTPIENQEKAPKPIKQVIKPKSTSTTTKSPSSTPTKSKKEEANRKVLVSSRTNSGLKRTPITKKETKPANPKITETSLKKDSNIVYKSSLISCNKDKSGEEEDILIVEKVAITPEKLLTPDGKKIIANELDGILTTAKDIVTKEKLSDSGATTAPTMPEDEKINESKKEIEVNESDKKVEEFKKAKDALKTPDEVADLPFHEEADEQKPKVAEKEIESEIETQEIVQVENAEYVLVSLDSSPEVLKRQVLDTVGLLDTELDEDSDKEDEYVETKQSTILPDIDEKTKLIEHLLESSKDLCEITEKIDELKKQNEHEITNHQIHEHLQNSNHDNTKTSNCTQLNKQGNPTQIQEEIEEIELQEKECIDEKRLNIDNENDKYIHGSSYVKEYNAENGDNTQDLKQITTTQGPDTDLENVAIITMDKKDSKASSKAGSICDEPLTSTRSRSGSKTEEPERNTENSTDKQRSKASSKAGSICDEPLKSPGPDISTDKTRSSSICQEQDKTNNVEEKQESKVSSKAGSVCDEPVKSPIHETNTSANVVPSRSGSITEEPENTNVTDMQRSKTSSTAGSICDETIKSPGPDISTDKIRSSSICQEQDKTNNVEEKQESKASSKAGSVCDEPVKSPVHEINTSANVVPSRSGSITEEPENTNVTDMQRSKTSSTAGSICDETIKSPGPDISTDKIRSSSICQEQDKTNNVEEKQESKASSKAGSVCDEPVKSPVHEINTSANVVPSRSGSITEEQENTNVTNMQKSKTSSKGSSICDELVRTPVHETITTAKCVSSRSGSITKELDITEEITINKQGSKASSKVHSVVEELTISPGPEINTDKTETTDLSSLVSQALDVANVSDTDKQESKASSKASSVCDEPVKSPIHETITSANAVPSRSGSITEEQENIQKNVTDIQRSKASSKASSVCEEPIKSPVHEIVNAITSITSSITHDPENTTKNATGSKPSSKASSVCDELVKSPVHETITYKNSVPCRSSSICDEPVKSPIQEIITSVNAVSSRSGSITEEKEITPEKVLDLQKSKTSSKASSICDETVKSPDHEIVNAITSRSSSLTNELENATNDVTGSKASSKAGSVCDEPVKSPIHETITSANVIPSRSGSITEPENTPENFPDLQKSKTSSKGSSICDETVKFPVHETIESANDVINRFVTATDKAESSPDNVSDIQRSKASSKASSVCEEPIKSPVHEIVNAITSITSSLTHDSENTTKNATGSKASSKASSVCDEPVKSPIHETITSANAVLSRSGSITEERENTTENVTDIQRSKASSKASSVCEEPIKSPVHEIVNAITSITSSITHDPENTTKNATGSKASSKASSVCDEPVKSPIHETITSANAVLSRSGSVTEKPESILDHVTDTQRSGSITEEQENTPENVTDMQRSKSSSKASSVCDEPVKSPVHETITSEILVSCRSGSITEEPENITDVQRSKASSKASSICDEPVKSPVHETIAKENSVISMSLSDSITDKSESILDNVTDMQISKVSSKPSSICDETVKSPVHETITSENSVSCRSGSITEEPENVTDIQRSKVSSKPSSICDEPVKSPVHETIEIANAVISMPLSESVTEKPESIPDNVTNIQKCNVSTTASSVCDEPVKHPIHEIVNEITNISSTLSYEIENTTKNATGSKASSKASSVCDEPIKSPIHESITSANAVSSRSGSITEEPENTPENVPDIQKSKTSIKVSSICDEPVKSPVDETIASANSIRSRSGSVTEKPDSIPDNVTDIQRSKASSKASSICDEPVKSPVRETVTSINAVTSRSGSITEKPENTPEHVPDIQKSKTSSKASSICDEPETSPVDETIASANSVINRSGSVTEKPESILDHVTDTQRSGSITEEQENTPENVTDMQRSKSSSKASSVCDEPVKSPIHETITSVNAVPSRSGSITEKPENTPEHVPDTQKSKTSSKASSVCDESIKSPVHEIVNAITSITSSLTHDSENTTKNATGSKASSKASSVCDEPVKSPIHETITSANAVLSRSGSITEEPENTTENVTDIQRSKASSKASSVCDEPIKSPVHEIVNAITSITSSLTHDSENTTKNATGSKASSKASSVCDEPVKSPIHETITSANAVLSRSGSITEEPENITENVTDIQRSKASSKASSVCDEPIKSPVHEIVNAITSITSSLTHDSENTTKNATGSKASSKASSVCDEPVKSPIHETITSANAVLSRSGSITEEPENTTENVTDIQRSKASSKASSVCEEPIKSPVHEIVNAITSITSSITHDPENTSKNATGSKPSSKASSVCDELVRLGKLEIVPDNVTDMQKSKTCSKASSICDESVKSPVYETVNAITSISSSVAHEPENTTKNVIDSKASSRASSVCDEPVKSPVRETTKLINSITSSSNTISQVSENIPENEIEKQGSKASSNSGSVCDELVKSPLCENKKSENTITNLSSSITQEPEIITDNHCSKASSKANSIVEEPLKSSELAIISTNGSESKSRSSSVNLEQDITHVSINDKQESEKSSVGQETEFPQIIGMDKHDVESCSRKDSFFQDKNNSSTFSSSSTSSICQEIDTQSSKLSSRKSSVVDESIGNPSKLHIGEKSSSLQESNVYEHNIDNNTKIFNKSGSLCDEMLNLPFNKVTENIISNEAYEKVVSPETTVGNTESKMVNTIESMCEESIKSDNDEICTKEHLVSSTSSLILHETEEEKCQLPRKSSVLEEPQNSLTEDNNTILSPSDCNKSNIIERKGEESKSFGRIGSLCEEIAKFLTDNDNKISTNITSESSCSLIESIPLKSNIDELKVETETLLQLNKNTDILNKIEKSLQLDDKVKVDEKHDNINEKNTDHSLPVKNITVSNNKPPNISTLLIEENNKTGIMNVAQMVGKNILDESLTKHTVITDNESNSLKTFTPIANVTSEECISKLSNVLIEDVVKTSDDKNIICDSSITDICMNQPLGVTLNSEDLGVTKDIVMQLKRDVHEALHQCSSDDERPFTPQSESSMSRSAMNIDEDDDDNEDNKIETDDDMPGSPMSTRPSPVQMQLDNRHVEINMDFNKALQEHRITRGEDLTATEANGNHVTEIKTTEHDNINQNQGTSSDTVQSWGKPLGLPPVQSINNNGFDPIREWGKPLGLPSPTQPILELAEPQNMSGKTTPKKNVKKIIDNKPIINVMDKDAQNRIRRSESPSKLRSRSSSRMSRINPIYLDLIYVPHHGNSKYVSADFFKRVRARNYVFSGTDPSKEVLNALIEGKQAWEDQDLEVTIIPTYDTDTLGQWVAENEELLTKLKIDLSPSASRCTIKLQDHNTSCSAYRLEF